VTLHAQTDINTDEGTVLLSNLQVTNTNFSSLDPENAKKTDELVKTFVPPSVTIALHRLVACVEKQEAAPAVQVKNDPPKIFVSDKPAMLLGVEGEPVRSAVPKTKLEYVVNTDAAVFFDPATSNYYLPYAQMWLTANKLEGPWSATAKLPQDMSALRDDPQWGELKKIIPPPAHAKGAVPMVFYSTTPAELISFTGQPTYSEIPGTQLSYAKNSSGPLFVYLPSNQYYYLTGGRWFRADSLEGPWTYATPDLPADFAKIPENSPVAGILSSVPGTEEAKDAVLLAQVPTTMTVNAAKAAETVKVAYDGEPDFKPIDGTSLSYAANTQDKVIKVADVYYLCLQGVWFMSSTPQGPWQTASSVPKEIYQIPPSSPVYNVTYVTQIPAAEGYVQSSYTAGYLGAFILGAATGAVIANGCGYYYGYPVYRPYPPAYGHYYGYPTLYGSNFTTARGAYGVSQTAYGPYGSATRAAAYNPYTGTYARGATASNGYGTRTVAQAYNPYTGTYGATRQGSSPTAQWGSSVVSQGNKSAYMQHYSTANGTVGSIQGSKGGAAAGYSTKYGSGAVGKTSSGDMYAGHDGNVYKNTGSGWKQYDNGSWNSVNKSGSGGGGQEKAQGSEQRSSTERSSSRSGGGGDEMGNMQREAQNRQRGGQESDRFQQFQRGGGDRWGGGGGGGRSFEGRGGGRRR
jgi:hypothetical protein